MPASVPRSPHMLLLLVSAVAIRSATRALVALTLERRAYRTCARRPINQTGINFSVPGGSFVAVCGKNGVGKSTLFKLLLRLYDVDAGEILVGGRSIKDYNPVWLRSYAVAVAAQKPGTLCVFVPVLSECVCVSVLCLSECVSSTDRHCVCVHVCSRTPLLSKKKFFCKKIGMYNGTLRSNLCYGSEEKWEEAKATDAEIDEAIKVGFVSLRFRSSSTCSRFRPTHVKMLLCSPSGSIERAC